MVSAWSFLLVAAQIFFLLNFLVVQSLSFDQTLENSDGTPRIERVSSRRFLYRKNPFFKNKKNSPNPNPNNDASFLRVSTRRIRSNTVLNTRKTVTVRIENPFNANATIDVRHPRDTIHFPRRSNDESLSTFTNNYQSSPTINDRAGNNETSRSARKCSEYHDAVEGLTRVMSLTGTSRALPTRNLTDGKCTNIRHLVVGGRTARRESLPHVVALGREDPENKKFVLHCGGSLVAPSWVLTAAHCTHGVGGGVAIARLGIQRLSDNNGQTITIRRWIRHPSYTPPAKYADIALLELERPVTFGPSIKPACLHQHYHNIPTFAWVCGWGATEFGGYESNTLQEAKLEFVNNVECAIKHNSSISVPEGVVPSMVCAGAPHNNWEQDACQGDSGGPLQIVHPTYTCLHQIIGITSFGSGCAFVDSPGVYTRVSYYLDWIENIVWPLDS